MLRLIRERGGLLTSVPDAAMLEAQRELAATAGLFCQPESATTLAALKTLAGEGRLRPGGGDVVVVLTGSGLKTLHLVDPERIAVHRLRLGELEDGLARLAGAAA